ncbi:MAG: hypothetical protein ACFE0P_04900 [Oceanicaulis sp.]
MGPNIIASLEFMPTDHGEQRGDAIAVRYRERGRERLMVIDAGNEEMGDLLIDYLRSTARGRPIDHLVSTRMTPLATGGLRQVLAEWEVREFVTMAPWQHTDQLERHFAVDCLEKSWHESAGLFDIGRAVEQTIDPKIRIREVMAGDTVGPFTVLAPSWRRYIETFVPGLQSAARRTKVIRDTCLVLYGEIGGGTLLHLGGAGPDTIADVQAEADRLGIDLHKADTIILPANPRAFGSPPLRVDEFFGRRSRPSKRVFIDPPSAKTNSNAYLRVLQHLPEGCLIKAEQENVIHWKEAASFPARSHFAVSRRPHLEEPDETELDDEELELDEKYAETTRLFNELMKSKGLSNELGPELPDED